MVGTIATYGAAALAGAALGWAAARRKRAAPARPPPTPGAQRALAGWIRYRWHDNSIESMRLRAAAEMLDPRSRIQ